MRQVRFLSKYHQTPTGLLVKPHIRGMGDCLLHHRDVHDHLLDAASEIIPATRPASIVLVSNHSTPSSPIRLRHRVSDDVMIQWKSAYAIERKIAMSMTMDDSR